MTSFNEWAKNKVLLASILIAFFTSGYCNGESLKIGVASNFRSTLDKMVSKFNIAHGVNVQISAASTGTLFAQVQNGAPFDILFAADRLRPALLEAEGHTRHRKTYAYGQLVFWTPKGPASETSFQHYKKTIAIANPKFAPYGIAAMDLLKFMKIKPRRLVYGNNVSQAFNFVRTGNASAGLVALSQVTHLNIPKDQFWAVPIEFHTPIEQQLVVLKAASKLSELFLAHTFSSESSKLIIESGYLSSNLVTGTPPTDVVNIP